MHRRPTLPVVRHLLAVVALSLAGAGAAHAQQIFVVHAADTNDTNIGPSCRIDQATIRGLFTQNPGLNRITRLISIDGGSVNRSTILNRLGSLPAGSNDAVLFYYSGHGEKDENGQNYCALPGGGRLYLSEVSRAIDRRGPRLNVVVADMCSIVVRRPNRGFAEVHQQEAPLIRPDIPPAFRSLFLQTRGTAVIVSSSVNQVAMGDNRQGGLFTASFQDFLSRNEQRKLTWQELFRGASGVTHEKFIRDNPRGVDGRAFGVAGFQTTQTPQAIRLDVSLGGPVVSPTQPRAPVFGVIVDSNNGDGVAVREVSPGSPAQRAGLEPRDILLELNGRAIRSTADFTRAVDQSGPVLNMLLRNFRDGREYRTSARLNRR